MAHIFEELDFQETPLGEISLRKRSEPRLNNKIIYEVKMNEEFLMSSLFVEAELQLAHLGLAALEEGVLAGKTLDVIVGGLGLGYTAYAALQNPNVKSLNVIDVMQPVIDWHEKGLVPMANELTSDDRCKLVLGDFFALATADTNGFNIVNNDKKVHAVLLDIDHTPSFWLSPGNSNFYTEQGLRSLANKIHSGGIFGLWSDEQTPNKDFTQLLDSIFTSTETHIVTFPNPYTREESSNTVYLARVA
jgi:spermidine synthase